MLDKVIRIQSFDVYPNGTLKPSALMRHMQQLAREDCDGLGATYAFMRELNTVFVLTRLAFELDKPVNDGEELLLKTYNNTITGVIFDREFEIFSGEEQIGRATTYWTLVRFDTRSLVRPKDFPVKFESHDFGIQSVEIPRRFDPEGLADCGERLVRVSDLDENDHLNNCVYADIALDEIPEFDGVAHWVRSVRLIFRREAKRGDRLLLSKKEENGRFVVFAVNGGKDTPCFEAEIGLEKLR